MHLLFGDLTVFRLVAGEKFAERSPPPIMISFQAQRVVYPGAHALRLAPSNCLLRGGQELGIH